MTARSSAMPVLRDALQQQRVDDERKLEKATYIAEQSLAAYREGEITFETLCQTVVRAAKPLKGSPSHGWLRKNLLGYVLEQAVEAAPCSRARRGRARDPRWLRDDTVAIVNRVSEQEGLPKTRSTRSGMSAFARTAEVLHGAGLPATAASVEKRYFEGVARKSPKLAKR